MGWRMNKWPFIFHLNKKNSARLSQKTILRRSIELCRTGPSSSWQTSPRHAFQGPRRTSLRSDELRLGRPVFALASYAVAGQSSLWRASVFVKTSPDKSPRQAIQAGKRQVSFAAFWSIDDNLRNKFFLIIHENCKNRWPPPPPEKKI